MTDMFEIRQQVPIEARSLIEMSAQITQLRERAETAEKNLAETEAVLIRIIEYSRNQHDCETFKGLKLPCQCLACGTKREILEIPFHVKLKTGVKKL